MKFAHITCKVFIFLQTLKFWRDKGSVTGLLTVSQIEPVILSPRVVHTHGPSFSIILLLRKSMTNNFLLFSHVSMESFFAWGTQTTGAYHHSENASN